MFDYRAELNRRTEQFAGYLRKGHNRAHGIAHGPCFMVFAERPFDDGDEEGELVESETQVVQHATELRPQATLNLEGDLDTVIAVDAPEFSGCEPVSQSRFVQYSFERDWFCADLPVQTLHQPEAAQIIRDRLGFFYLQDRPEFTLFEEDVDGYDPFRKVYIYGDERSAAADLAFIYFGVWKFPVDWQFYVRAAAFSGKHAWEQDHPIE